MKRWMIGAALALAGCDAPMIAQPDPVRQQMLAACQGGDMTVCNQIAQNDLAERNRRSSIPLPVYQTTQLNSADFQNSMQPVQMAPRQTTCRPQFGGQVVCNSY